MIFRTINADAKKLTEQFGLLNKSFRDIKKDFANGLGFKNSLFQTSISKTDYQALQKFNSAIKVTNDGLTKSQRITKAWNENMTGCSIAAKRMGNDLVTGKKNIQDISKAMNTASGSTKALGVAMNVMANVGFMLAITAITKVISELAQAQDNAVQAAKEATETYKSELDSIADYKQRLSELHEELKSGNLSYEETKTKRTELMTIQDELIEKFGTEKSAIESVTDAVKGQVDALDDLNEKAYRDWVAKADEQTFWNKLLPGGKSGLDQAVDYMETEKTVSFMDMQNANLSDELQAIQKEIDETIRAKYNLDKTFSMFNVTGTPDELRTQLDNIRQDYADISKRVFEREKLPSGMWEEYRKETTDSINEAITSLDKGLEKHQDTYRTYIEGLIKYDSEYSDEYANILQKRAELESAQNSGNAEEVKRAKQEFMDSINDAIIASDSDESIKKYFESLYPELQAEFDNWKFEFDLEVNKDGIADTAKAIGEKYTATDLLNMVDTEGVQEGEESFNSLIDKAIEYGVCTDKSAEEIQKLIDLLVELGIVQDNVKGDTFNDKNLISLSEALSQSAGEGDTTYSDLINSYEQERATMQSYLDKIANNTLESSDKLSLATEFGITGDSVDELRTRIESLMDLKLDGIIKKIDELLNGGTLSGQAITDLRNLKQSIIDISTEAKKASPIKIDAEVNSLSSIQSLSTGLEQLGKIYADVKDKKEFDWSSILNNESFTKEFGHLGDVYNDFIRQISDAPDDIKKCQDAFNDLATAYIYAAKDINGNSIMGNLTEETKDATIAMLEQMGVENAKQFVEAQLEAKILAHKLAVEGLDLANRNSLPALQQKIAGLLNEADAAGVTTSALFDLIAQEQIFANTNLNVGQKMAALQALAEAFGITADAALGATEAINLEKQIRLARHYGANDAQIDAYATQLSSKMQDAIHAKFGNISVSYKAPASGGSSKGSGSKGSSTKKEPQEIDWTANSIENLISKINLLNAKLEKSTAYKTQLKYLKQIRKETENLAVAYKKQAEAYKKYWENTASKLTKAQKADVMSGKKFSIKEYGEETYKKLTDAQDAWKQYQEAKIKVIETQQEAIEAKIAEYQRRVDYQQSRVDKLEAQSSVTTSTQKKNELENKRIKALKKQYEYEIKIAKAEGDTIEAKQLELELEAEIIASKKAKFDNIVTKYENRASRKGYRLQDIENAVSLTEAKGSYVNTDYYNRQYEEQEALAKMYAEEEANLQKRLATIKKYSDEWYEALETIQDVQNKENDALVTMQELADKVNDVAKSLDDLIVNKFSAMISEADTLMTLLGDKLVDDDLGDFTSNGIAALGLIYSQMQAENEKGEQLRKQLAILEKQMDSYKDGETVTFIDANGMKRTISSLKELKNLEDETRNSIQESSKAEYTYYQNIIDLMKERYEAERNYLDDLISKKKELLDAEQDLHQYAKDIKEQADSIASLQKQLAALSGDNSLEGQARRQKIEAQLQESKDTLAETEYDRLISDQKDMLDNLSAEYAEMLESYMKNDDALYKEGLAVIKENSAIISDVTASVADKWGMELSSEMESVVGNINTVDSTLNGIRSDLQDYFASTQQNKETDSSGGISGRFTSGDPASIRDSIQDIHDTVPKRGSNDTTSDRKDMNIMSGTGMKVLKPASDNPSGGKNTGTGELVSIGTGKLSDLSGNNQSTAKTEDGKEIIRVDNGNGEIMELVKVDIPPEWKNFGRSIVNSAMNAAPNLDAITRQTIENAPTNIETTNNSVNIENVSFSLPNVSNYRELMQEAQADPKFEGMIGHMIDTKLTGSNRLNKYRTKF